MLENFNKMKLIVRHSFNNFPSLYTSRPVENPLGEETSSQGTISPFNRLLALLPGLVPPLWQELITKVKPTCLDPWSKPSLQNTARHLAKLMARRWFCCAVCYITFKTRLSFKEHMKRGIYLLKVLSAYV